MFQVNCHLTPRPILLTRHGESLDNVKGRIGGDSSLRSYASLFFFLSLASLISLLYDFVVILSLAYHQ
jgi:6-phosphofructo-2-kinase / fructose-2,6-biphosphatase 3